MGVNRVIKRGKARIEVRKRWPDGTIFRRYCPNRTVAKQLLHEIEVVIAKGTWRELKETLCGNGTNGAKDLTLEEFAKIYLEEYCQLYNRRPDFKEQALSSIVRILGKVRLKNFCRFHAEKFVSARSKEVAPATINRGLAVLKNMLTFAVKQGYIESNPLVGFSRLPEEEMPLRMMTLEEERRLVTCVAECNPIIGAYTAILGETGLRKSEGLRVQWSDIDWQPKRVTVSQSKTGEPRYVPLSDYALEWLSSLQRHPESPWVFTQPNGKPLKDPRESFYKGREMAGVKSVQGFHDLRHFRATQWLLHGRGHLHCQVLPGSQANRDHSALPAHFVPDHGERCRACCTGCGARGTRTIATAERNGR